MEASVNRFLISFHRNSISSIFRLNFYSLNFYIKKNFYLSGETFINSDLLSIASEFVDNLYDDVTHY